MPLVSVITTVFNAEKHVKESLLSLSEQMFQDFELIIVDDGCTDSSMAIINDLLPLFRCVQAIKNESNLGVPASRNKALYAAVGEYIAIHDADDISLPNRLSKEVGVLDNNKEITFLGSHAAKISNDDMFVGMMIYPPKTTEEAIRCIAHWKLNPIIDPSCMYRKEDIVKAGLYSTEPDMRYAQDFELWCRMLLSGKSMTNIQEPLIKYRVNPDGVTSAHYAEMRKATDIIWENFKQEINKKN